MATNHQNCISQELERYFLELHAVNKEVWHIRDRENRCKVAVKIIGKPTIVKPILELMNKEDGYLQ